MSDNGARFRVVVTNAFGTTTSNEAVLDRHPEPGAHRGRSASPRRERSIQRGTTISYSGTGTDAEDGTLPASAFTWQVDFHHDTHCASIRPDDERRQERLVHRFRDEARHPPTSGIESI